jgi:hypothetical protein
MESANRILRSMNKNFKMPRIKETRQERNLKALGLGYR